MPCDYELHLKHKPLHIKSRHSDVECYSTTYNMHFEQCRDNHHDVRCSGLVTAIVELTMNI